MADIRTDANGDLIIEALHQGSHDHFTRVVPFNLSQHIRQIIRDETSRQPTRFDEPLKAS